MTQVLQSVRHLRAVEDAPVSRNRDLAVRPSISVVGLGYVGAVSMACLSHLGFRMIGVDTSEVRVDSINRGVSPIVENRLEDLLHESGVPSFRLDQPGANPAVRLTGTGL